MSKTLRQGWVGSYTDHFFGHLENGEWVNLGLLKYWWLKINGYTVRKINK